MTRFARGLAATLALAALAALALALPTFARGSAHGLERARQDHRAEPPRTLLAFHSMFGVDGAFVGDVNPVDGIPGDELPWEIGNVVGRLDTAGNLFVLVRGLVFKNDPSVPPDLVGTNDETAFRAVVSCLTESGGTVSRSNVVTQGFPADPQGNSLISTHVDLPDPCLAPDVLILAGSEDKWFAVTGFESGD